MNVNELAVSERMALKMFWENGHDTEMLLTEALAVIRKIKPATDGYYYAKDVSKAIEQQKV